VNEPRIVHINRTDSLDRNGLLEKLGHLTSLAPLPKWLTEAEVKILLPQIPVRQFLNLILSSMFLEGHRSAIPSFYDLLKCEQGSFFAAISLKPTTCGNSCERFFLIIEISEQEKDSILVIWQAKANELSEKKELADLQKTNGLTDHHLELAIKEAVERVREEVIADFERRRKVLAARLREKRTKDLSPISIDQEPSRG